MPICLLWHGNNAFYLDWENHLWTPMQTFLDSRHLADEKMLDQLPAATPSEIVAQRNGAKTQRSEGAGGARVSAA